MPNRILFGALVGAVLGTGALADTATLTSARDNTIYQDHPTNSNGKGPSIFTGTAADADPVARRRGRVPSDTCRSRAVRPSLGHAAIRSRQRL